MNSASSNRKQKIENLSKWQKALSTNAKWTKTELGDVIHWLRQALAIACGLIWGLVPITGAIGILSYLLLSFITLFVYYSKFLGLEDDEEFGSRWDLIQEGYLTAFGLFLVSWIVTYNFMLEFVW